MIEEVKKLYDKLKEDWDILRDTLPDCSAMHEQQRGKLEQQFFKEIHQLYTKPDRPELNCNHCQFSNEDDLCDKGHLERQPGKAGFALRCLDFRGKPNSPELREKIIGDIKEVFRSYSLELDDSGQDWVENDGFYYEYARRIYNAGYRLALIPDIEELKKQWREEEKEILIGMSVRAMEDKVEQAKREERESVDRQWIKFLGTFDSLPDAIYIPLQLWEAIKKHPRQALKGEK